MHNSVGWRLWARIIGDFASLYPNCTGRGACGGAEALAARREPVVRYCMRGHYSRIKEIPPACLPDQTRSAGGSGCDTVDTIRRGGGRPRRL